MVEERGPYPVGKPRPASWTKLFGTFLVALDPFKLLVAAAGIVVTALGWWLISITFYYSWTIPKLSDYQEKVSKAGLAEGPERDAEVARQYGKALDTWAMMYELAGPTERANKDAAELYSKWYQAKYTEPAQRNQTAALGYGGKYRTMPWAENRGPNPFLMTTTLIKGSGAQRQYVYDWFLAYQVPNLIEPLLKFITPVFYLFDGRAGFWTYVYLLLMILWLLVVWGFFGGVITRMAILSLAGKDGGGVREAISYVKTRYLSYLLSPLLPIALIGFMILCCMLFGIIHWIPLLGDLWDGLLWWLPLLAGLVMTLVLVGMIGYPMMYTTLSAEGSDTFDALSRSYNYVYESPWYYIWYSFVAILYGAVLTLFVVVVGSLTVYFAKFGVSKFPAWGADRSPEYLFVYAPDSLGWRKVLTDGSPAAVDSFNETINVEARDAYMKDFAWYNHMGAGMASFWVTLVFMMTIGFSYSYFWTASSQIYLLMRKRVDETDLDEVYIEEEAPEPPAIGAAPASPTPAPAPVPTPQAPVSVPVDPPTLKTPEPPPATT